MTPQRWDQVQGLFEAALAQDPDERTAYLQRACDGDDALFREVVSLLEADDQALSFLDGHALEGIDALDLPDGLSFEGAQIGPYRLLRLIGEGGMGLVYLAERADGVFEQQVALKLIKRGMDTAQIVRRFEAERQILARLQHENVARLLDGGVTDEGLPYFVMEYVDGVPIDEYCDTHRLSIDERLDLFVTVCKAVLYAHANLVVHRDLKPENILVTQAGTVKLLDFGIAKVLGGDEEQTQLTQVGGRVLTPGYASPEQIRGEVIGTASDIYSLGVVLYELLVGQRPYAATGATPEAQALGATEPERPSTAIGRTTQDADTQTAETISQARRTQPEKLRRRLSGDLDVICLKALRKEPERRYGTVEAFSEDIRRHRTGLPVLARRDAVGYRVRKFMVRHRTGVAISAAVVLLIAVLVGFYTVRLSQERDRAQVEAEKARQVAAFLESVFETTDPSEARGETVTARELLDTGRARIAEELANQPLIRATLLRTLGNVYRKLSLFEAAQPLLEEAFTLHHDAYGLRHPETASSQTALALILDEVGETVAAEGLYRQALATRRGLLISNHPDLAESLANLGYLLQNQGADEEAEALFREELAINRAHLPPDHPQVTTSMTRLARLLRHQNRYDEAEALLREALAAQRLHYGGAHPDVASTLRNLASLLRDTDRYEEAGALYRETIAMRRTLYGDLHTEVGVALNSYAQLLRHQGKLDEAVEVAREAITVAEHVYGPVHDEPATGYFNIGLILRDADDLGGAQQAFQQALDIENQVYDTNHPSRAYTLLELADVYQRRGAADKAEPLIRQALAAWQISLPADHRNLIDARRDLGVCLADLGRYAEAEQMLREALAMRIKLRGDDHVEVAGNRSRLAEVLTKIRQFEEAEALLLAALPIFQAGSDDQDEDVQQTYRNLIALYEAWGKPDRAEPYRARLPDAGEG